MRLCRKRRFDSGEKGEDSYEFCIRIRTAGTYAAERTKDHCGGSDRSQHSDIEIQDFHVHLISERMANIFKTERKYRSVPTEHGEVLLPRYRLEYDETVTFGLKKFLCFKSVTFQGIRF